MSDSVPFKSRHGFCYGFCAGDRVIISGKTRVLVDGQEVIIAIGDHILIHPGTPNNAVAENLEDMKATTITQKSVT